MINNGSKNSSLLKNSWGMVKSNLKRKAKKKLNIIDEVSINESISFLTIFFSPPYTNLIIILHKKY